MFINIIIILAISAGLGDVSCARLLRGGSTNRPALPEGGQRMLRTVANPLAIPPGANRLITRRILLESETTEYIQPQPVEVIPIVAPEQAPLGETNKDNPHLDPHLDPDLDPDPDPKEGEEVEMPEMISSLPPRPVIVGRFMPRQNNKRQEELRQPQLLEVPQSVVKYTPALEVLPEDTEELDVNMSNLTRLTKKYSQTYKSSSTMKIVSLPYKPHNFSYLKHVGDYGAVDATPYDLLGIDEIELMVDLDLLNIEMQRLIEKLRAMVKDVTLSMTIRMRAAAILTKLKNRIKNRQNKRALQGNINRIWGRRL